MSAAIEPRRFGKHKIYHIISYFKKWENNLLAAAVQIHDVIVKNEHFHLQSTPCANIWTGTKGANRITLIKWSEAGFRSYDLSGQSF